MAGLVVRIAAFTFIPRREYSTPAASRFRPSILGTLPVPCTTRSQVTVSVPSGRSTVTVNSSPCFSIFAIFAFVRRSMPNSAVASTSIATKSGSKGPKGRSIISSIDTSRAPARLATWANSIAMNPPPTKAMRSGRSRSSRKSVLVTRYSSPGMFSVIGRAPVAMWKCLAVKVSPFNSMVSGPVNRACPSKTSIPAFSSPASMRGGIASVNVRLKAIMSDQLTDVPASRPLPFMFSAHSTPSVTAISIFLGSQPRRAQVPPWGSLSMLATLQPAFAAIRATPLPPVPPPITIRS